MTGYKKFERRGRSNVFTDEEIDTIAAELAKSTNDWNPYEDYGEAAAYTNGFTDGAAKGFREAMSRILSRVGNTTGIND